MNETTVATAQATAQATTPPVLHRGVLAQRAWHIAAAVADPEVPVLTIDDLGVLRSITVGENDVAVSITPTYSGCPAMESIRDDVVTALNDAGFENVVVNITLSPAWTTDWISAEGKEKLERFGIAAPSGRASAAGGPVRMRMSVKCPQCQSLNTRELSHFGSTSCKALYQCLDCLEPFDYFKVL
ncbi:phenylacetate-CoA oxygenase subunit PaaJ [Diaminobutyricibacter tongyongensis]|uniref:Phenylacetate-CoA oxygenase subunit PaaJ n=1 Tax=Leifsonia tongyongensis TaxID=1268043 RepID=A0A6L9XS93_9MICO|nr:1,2-phenylacetyl-CoA epoxidase subunit PaaD [Diaminobutyricibacter tongyongensis]NEN04283.1 phenylacetate-CoA oxygenase subunit PaaJ [Diaminobutyricibacter tongyongensis]